MLFWMLQIGTRERTTAEWTSMTYTGREKAEVSLAKCTSQHKERPEDWSLMREEKCIQFYEIWLLTFLCVKKKSNAANIIYGNSWILECIRIIKNPQNASFFDVWKLLFCVFFRWDSHEESKNLCMSGMHKRVCACFAIVHCVFRPLLNLSGAWMHILVWALWSQIMSLFPSGISPGSASSTKL